MTRTSSVCSSPPRHALNSASRVVVAAMPSSPVAHSSWRNRLRRYFLFRTSELVLEAVAEQIKPVSVLVSTIVEGNAFSVSYRVEPTENRLPLVVVNAVLNEVQVAFGAGELDGAALLVDGDDGDVHAVLHADPGGTVFRSPACRAPG